jgi:hypothetical protein
MMKAGFADRAGYSAVLRRLILLGHGPVGPRHRPCRSELDGARTQRPHLKRKEKKKAYDVLVAVALLRTRLYAATKRRIAFAVDTSAVGVTLWQGDANQNTKGGKLISRGERAGITNDATSQPLRIDMQRRGRTTYIQKKNQTDCRDFGQRHPVDHG